MAVLQPLDPRQVTAAISRCVARRELTNVIKQHIGSMDAISAAAALTRLATLGVTEEDPYEACLQQYFKHMEGDSPRTLCTVVNALCNAPGYIKEQHVAAVQQLLTAFVGDLQCASPLDISRMLWAAASLGMIVPEVQLQQLTAAFAASVRAAAPRGVANVLWACAKLRYCPQELLAAPDLALLLEPGVAKDVANAAWACGQLGHRDEQLMGALLAEMQQRLVAGDTSDGSNSLSSPTLCNTCWAVAVLDLQQHAQQVLQLAKACSRIWSAKGANCCQLWQVHTWLLDFQLAGAQGLQGSLTERQLWQCRAAWERGLQGRTSSPDSNYQRSVFEAVQLLPVVWQQQQQMEQQSMGRDGVTPDGALLIDIAGRTAAGVLVAVEADGPTHFRQPDGGLMGTTQYRNRALAVRGYRLVSVPWFEWQQLSKEEKQQYLLQLAAAAGVT
jgi:hypothetical protein